MCALALLYLAIDYDVVLRDQLIWTLHASVDYYTVAAAAATAVLGDKRSSASCGR